MGVVNVHAGTSYLTSSWEFKLLPSAHSLVEWIICFTRCVATQTSIVFGVLLSGALSTFLRLTAEGVVGNKEDWKVDGKGDVGGKGGKARGTEGLL